MNSGNLLDLAGCHLESQRGRLSVSLDLLSHRVYVSVCEGKKEMSDLNVFDYKPHLGLKVLS